MLLCIWAPFMTVRIMEKVIRVKKNIVAELTRPFLLVQVLIQFKGWFIFALTNPMQDIIQ